MTYNQDRSTDREKMHLVLGNHWQETRHDKMVFLFLSLLYQYTFSHILPAKSHSTDLQDGCHVSLITVFWLPTMSTHQAKLSERTSCCPDKKAALSCCCTVLTESIAGPQSFLPAASSIPSNFAWFLLTADRVVSSGCGCPGAKTGMPQGKCLLLHQLGTR